MIKKQKIFAIIAAALVVALIPLYIFVVLPLTKQTAQTATDSNREIMYTQIERANIKSIEINNSHGNYKFVYMDEYGDFYIEGSLFAPYDENLFSQLVVGCGYTLAMATVENENPEKLSEYGLDDASDPAYFILTTKENVSYKVLVGNKIVTGTGYYARMDGENKVYVLDTLVENTVLAPVEAYVTPMLIYPTTSVTYAEIKTFELYKGAYLPSDFNVGGGQGSDKQEQDSGESSSDTNSVLSEPIIKLHFVESQNLGVTSNAIYYIDYPGDGAYSASDLVNFTLQQFIEYEGESTVVLDPQTEDLEKYGLLGDAKYTLYLINYMSGKDEKGNYIKIPIKNRVVFSDVITDEKTGMQFRYAHSLFFNENAAIYNNLIVKVPEYNCAFLSYDLNSWVDAKLFAINITQTSDIRVESGETDIRFHLTGEGTTLEATDQNGHKPQTENFKRFYQTLLMMTKGGFVSLTEDEKNALTADESNVTCKVTIKTREGKEFVYRFYSLGQQTYYTVNGEGAFYLETRYVTKLVSDAVRVTRDEIVYVDNAY